MVTIRGIRCERGVFGDGAIVARAIDGRTGNRHQPRLRRINTQPFQQLGGGSHGAEEVFTRVGNGHTNGRSTGQVVNHVRRAAGLLQQPQVARLDVPVEPMAQAPRRSLGSRPNAMAKADNLMTLARQPARQVLADETVRATDEDVRHRQGRTATNE